MSVQEFIGAHNPGPIGQVVVAASGVPLSMRAYRAITFITNEADGSTIITLTQHTSTAAGAADVESDLAIITGSDDVTLFAADGSAAPARAAAQAAANTYDLADSATYDSIAITVRSDQLSDGCDFVEATVDGGTLMAIGHSARFTGEGVEGLPSLIAHP